MRSCQSPPAKSARTPPARALSGRVPPPPVGRSRRPCRGRSAYTDSISRAASCPASTACTLLVDHTAPPRAVGTSVRAQPLGDHTQPRPGRTLVHDATHHLPAAAPAADPAAVHAMRGAHHLVVAPPVRVEHIPRAATGPKHRPQGVRRLLSGEQDVRSGATHQPQARRCRRMTTRRVLRAPCLRLPLASLLTMTRTRASEATPEVSTRGTGRPILAGAIPLDTGSDSRTRPRPAAPRPGAGRAHVGPPRAERRTRIHHRARPPRVDAGHRPCSPRPSSANAPGARSRQHTDDFHGRDLADENPTRRGRPIGCAR